MRLSLNINGDLPVKDLIERIRIVEGAGIEQIWIGELEQFQDPIEIAEEIEPETSAEICVLLSPSRNPCSEIIASAERYTTGLIPGRAKDLELFISCLRKVKEKAGVVYAGVSGPIITERASEYADGLLFNYVYPQYIEWVKGFMKMETEIRTSAFGPALLLPSPFYEELLIAAAVVLQSNQFFLETFDLQEMSQQIPVDPSKLIRLRQGGVYGTPEFESIMRYSQDLLELFTISGELEEVSKRISQLLQLCDNVVLGDPFFRDIDSIKSLKRLI